MTALLDEIANISLAQQAKLKDPDGGFDPLLEVRISAALPVCASKGIRIITNMGAAPTMYARVTRSPHWPISCNTVSTAAITRFPSCGASTRSTIRPRRWIGWLARASTCSS